MFPDSGCALVVEDVEKGGNLCLRQGLGQRRIARRSANSTPTSTLTLVARMTFANLISQLVHVFGFIRLG
jgi:hypothetical protein